MSKAIRGYVVQRKADGMYLETDADAPAWVDDIDAAMLCNGFTPASSKRMAEDIASVIGGCKVVAVKV